MSIIEIEYLSSCLFYLKNNNYLLSTSLTLITNHENLFSLILPVTAHYILLRLKIMGPSLAF